VRCDEAAVDIDLVDEAHWPSLPEKGG
jgi:hypothetical protein